MFLLNGNAESKIYPFILLRIAVVDNFLASITRLEKSGRNTEIGSNAILSVQTRTHKFSF